MNWRKGLLLAAISATLSSVACIIYKKIYSDAFYVDFGIVLGVANIISACLMGCFIMALGYILIGKWKGDKAIGWLNILYGLISFASIVTVLSFSLPLDIESPEMFPGIAIPMHFFPLLSFLIIYPFFKQKGLVKNDITIQ